MSFLVPTGWKVVHTHNYCIKIRIIWYIMSSILKRNKVQIYIRALVCSMCNLCWPICGGNCLPPDNNHHRRVLKIESVDRHMKRTLIQKVRLLECLPLVYKLFWKLKLEKCCRPKFILVIRSIVVGVIACWQRLIMLTPTGDYPLQWAWCSV